VHVLTQVCSTQIKSGFMFQYLAKELHNAVCNCEFEIT
jgi:hypothetical protein